MLNLLRDWLVQQGLGGQTAAFVTTAVEIALVITLAAIADIVARRIILRQLEKLVGQTSTVWDDIIVKRRVFHRLLHLAPALVIYVFAQPVLEGYDLWIVVVRRASLIYMLLVTLLAIDGVLNAGVDILRSSKFSRNLPVKVVVQVLKLVLYSVATIALLSLIIGQSPSLLLGGLGAMTAVLMLIFKDSILGLVAGIQLSANQMVAPGDWIEMPKYGARWGRAGGRTNDRQSEELGQDDHDHPDLRADHRVVQELAWDVRVGRTADQARHQHRHELDSLLYSGDARALLEDPIHHGISGAKATRDLELERGAERRCVGPAQRPTAHQPRHVQSLCRSVSAQPSDDPPRR